RPGRLHRPTPKWLRICPSLPPTPWPLHPIRRGRTQPLLPAPHIRPPVNQIPPPPKHPSTNNTAGTPYHQKLRPSREPIAN
ncbi:hypothetical protein PCANC_11883, partial [Puccinia coronata f. sp. avenae]